MKLAVLLVIFFLMPGVGKAQISDSLFSAARDDSKSLQERVILYDEIGWQYSSFDPENSILYADTAVMLARQSGDSGSVALALNGKSIPYLRTGKYNDALNVLQEALTADSSDLSLKARILGKVANVHQELGQMQEALTTFIRCEKIFIETGDSARLGQLLSNIGDIHCNQGNFDKGETYIRRGIAILKAQDNKFGLAAAYNTLCEVYELRNELDSALHYAQTSTALVREMDYLPEIGNALMTEGGILRKMNRDSEGVGKYQQALKIAEEIDDKANIMFASMNIGNFFYERERWDEAKPLYLKGAAIGEELGITEKLINTYAGLTDIYIKEGDLDSLYIYRGKYEAALQTRFDQEEALALAEITAKYEDAQQKATIAQQQLEISEDKATIAQQRVQNIALIGGLVLLAIGILFWINRNRSRQQLALNKAVFAEREKGFSQVIEATELERDRISKDLHDGIGQQLTALKISLNSLAKKVGTQHETDLNSVLESFTKSAEDVRLLSHQMMPRMLMDFGLPEAVDDLLRNSFFHADMQSEFHHKGMEQRIDKNVEIAVFRVIQELINNALKHSGASVFSVQLIRSEKKLAGFISDDGKGFNPEQLAEGHGLKNMKSRLALINGSIDIESSPGQGSSISISIPLS